MKRYTLWQSRNSNDEPLRRSMEEDPEGGWVRWQDFRQIRGLAVAMAGTLRAADQLCPMMSAELGSFFEDEPPEET